ncbi:MAG: permease, partial [Gemmatimonadota bacterium]
MPANLLIGMGANFFDTLGIGSFATSTAVLRLFHLVEDENIPGTLNVGHALPTILEAALFLSAVPVELATLILMVLAGGIGAWFGTGVVV